MIELYPFLLTRGITPDTPAHALGLTVRQPGLGVEGNSEKPRPVQPMDEAGAKERAACTMGKSGLPAGVSSRYKGVYWNKRGRIWQTQIGVCGKNIYLGSFHDEEEAAETYNEAAKQYFGEYARLNVLS